MAESLPPPVADNGPSQQSGHPSPAGVKPLVLRATTLWLSSEYDARANGIRTIEPPAESKQAVRGSLFVVADLRGDGEGLRALTDRVVGLLQRSYYTARGSHAQVIVEAVRNAMAMVAEHNRSHPDDPTRLNVAVAALLGGKLQLACEGGAFAVLRTGSQVEIYPGQPGVDRQRTATEQNSSLDGPVVPDAVEVLSWKLKPGDALLLATPQWADKVDVKTLAATVLYVDTDVAQDAADGLRAQAGRGAPPGLLIVFDETGPVAATAPSLPAGLTLTPGPEAATSTSTAARPAGAPPTHNPLTASLRGVQGALPTAVSARPPLDAPPIGPPPAPQPAPAARPFAATEPGDEELGAAGEDEDFAPPVFPTLRVEAAPQQSDVAPAQSPWAPLRAAPPVEASPADATPASPEAGVGEQAGHLAEEAPVQGSSRTQSAVQTIGAAGAAVGAGARVGMERARGVFRGMLPEARPGAAHDDVDDWGDASGSWAEEKATTAAAAPMRAQPFQPPPTSTGGRARLFVLVALLVALLVVVLVVGVLLRNEGVNRDRAESLVTLAQARLLNAQESLETGDTRTALNFLSEAEDYVENSIELVGASGPVNDLLDAIRSSFDDASNVQPLYALTSPLIAFPAGSAPTRLVVQDQEIYVLDPGRSVVERYRMDATLDRVPDGVGAPVIRTGDVIEGATVGTMVDIAWLPPVPGFADKATLLVLDNENQLFSYDPRVEGPRALELANRELFGPLRQVETYLGRIYLADAGEGQMWRYSAGRYSSEAPSAWFAEALRLDELNSLRIDGDVWLLMRNGQVLRYRDGEQLPFSLDQSVGLIREAVDLFVGDGTNPFLYVADGGTGRVWVFDKEGVYQKQLSAPEGDALRGLSGLFIEDVTDSLFLLTSSALYKHSLPRS